MDMQETYISVCQCNEFLTINEFSYKLFCKLVLTKGNDFAKSWNFMQIICIKLWCNIVNSHNRSIVWSDFVLPNSCIFRAVSDLHRTKASETLYNLILSLQKESFLCFGGMLYSIQNLAGDQLVFHPLYLGFQDCLIYCSFFSYWILLFSVSSFLSLVSYLLFLAFCLVHLFQLVFYYVCVFIKICAPSLLVALLALWRLLAFPLLPLRCYLRIAFPLLFCKPSFRQFVCWILSTHITG